MDTQEHEPLLESSPSVQAHLGILQNVVQRMATNSTSTKAWCITVVSAILVLVADREFPNLAWLAILPTVLFGALDTYYLALEKGFRQSYNDFVKKLHEGRISAEDLYSIEPAGKTFGHQMAALKSFSIWGFYSGLLGLVVLAKNIILA